MFDMIDKALSFVEELICDDTILLESDLVYDYEVIQKLVEMPYENIVYPLPKKAGEAANSCN